MATGTIPYEKTSLVGLYAPSTPVDIPTSGAMVTMSASFQPYGFLLIMMDANSTSRRFCVLVPVALIANQMWYNITGGNAGTTGAVRIGKDTTDTAGVKVWIMEHNIAALRVTGVYGIK